MADLLLDSLAEYCSGVGHHCFVCCLTLHIWNLWGAEILLYLNSLPLAGTLRYSYFGHFHIPAGVLSSLAAFIPACR
jgi:hypothetical protein